MIVRTCQDLALGFVLEDDKKRPHLVRADILLTLNDRLAKHGVHRELRHASPELRQLPSVIQCPQCIQQFKCTDERLARWWIHELKLHEVIDPQRLEHKDGHTEIRTLDFWYRIFFQFVREGPLCVQPEGFAWSHPSCTTSALIRGSSRALDDQVNVVDHILKC